MIVLPLIAGFAIGLMLYVLTRGWFWAGVGAVLAAMLAIVMIETVVAIAAIAAAAWIGWLLVRRWAWAPQGQSPPRP